MAWSMMYDATDSLSTEEAEERPERGPKLAVYKLDDFRTHFDSWRDKGEKYDRLLIATHGSPGRFYIDNAFISPANIDLWFGNRRYEQIFEEKTHIHLNGCNIAEDEVGWQLLEKVARIFLFQKGGRASAWTSAGLSFGWSGHVKHFTGHVRTVRIAPGGQVTREVNAGMVTIYYNEKGEMLSAKMN